MSKRTRHEDNSKRRQPVQQQRAEAARQAISEARAATRLATIESGLSPVLRTEVAALKQRLATPRAR